MFATCQVFEVNTADAAKGNLKELEAIAAAVIGGIVMTGGFGTVVGIIVGAFIFGIAKEAFFYIPGHRRVVLPRLPWSCDHRFGAPQRKHTQAYHGNALTWLVTLQNRLSRPPDW